MCFTGKRNQDHQPSPSLFSISPRLVAKALLFVIKDHPREVSIVTSEDAQSALYALLTTRYGIAQPGASTIAPATTPATSAARPPAGASAAAAATATSHAPAATPTSVAAPVGAAAPSPATANGGAVANGNSNAQVICLWVHLCPWKRAYGSLGLFLHAGGDTPVLPKNRNVVNSFLSVVCAVLAQDRLKGFTPPSDMFVVLQGSTTSSHSAGGAAPMEVDAAASSPDSAGSRGKVCMRLLTSKIVTVWYVRTSWPAMVVSSYSYILQV